MIKLRDYQQAITQKIRDAWGRVLSVLAVLATGGGKTVIFSSIIHDHKGASAAIVHRKEIVSQIACSLAQLEVKHRVVAPPHVVATIRRKQLKRFGKSYVDQQAQCGVVSVQTLTSKSSAKDAALQRWLKQVTLAVFDEGHHYVKSGIWGKAVDMFVGARLLFVTASPERADGKGLGVHADGFVDEMVEGPSMRWLMKHGYLSKYKYYCPDTDLNIDDLPITASGDVNSKVMRQRTVESHLVGDAVQHYHRYAPGTKAIVFTHDVQTAEEIAAAFKMSGVNAVALSGGSDDSFRDKSLEQFEFGDLQVLVNVDLFDEGFDVPGVETVILARVTFSLAKYLQMCGRGLRPVYRKGADLSTVEGRLQAIADGPKPHATIIDMVRNYKRCGGLPEWPRQWALEGREKGTGTRAPGTLPQRVCLKCTQPYEVVHAACPYCGTPAPEPEGRSTPEQVGGDLYALDVEALAALFDEIAKADMSDEEYSLDQIARNMPSVARRKDALRHKKGRHRRQVLRELVGWWVGMQPEGRPLSEIHKRFYHRFGVDIGTAFTLSGPDTDKLITKIQQHYTEDLSYD